MTEILPPTRAQLSEFIKNHETIRRFELLFRLVGEDLFEADTNGLESALAGVNNALGQIKELRDDLDNIISVLEAKANQSNDQISKLSETALELEFLMQAVNTIG